MLREKLLTLESDLSTVPSPYAMNIKEFKAVVDAYKKEAPKYLTYIYLMRDPRSRYAAYEESQRRKEVSMAVFGKSLKEEKVLTDAMAEYSKNMSPAALLLESAIGSVAKLRSWFNNVNVEHEDYDALKHVRILESMGKTVHGLKELERAVEQESETSTTYGNVTVSKYNE
jgi:hypothetical protein